MASIEMNTDSAICYRCGTKYSKIKGYFSVSYAVQHKGVGHLPICKNCVETMYNTYLSQCGNAKDAVRQMCRKLDVYWSETAYEAVAAKSTPRTIMQSYLAKLNTNAYLGKSYDDSLLADGTLWSFSSDSIDELKSDEEEMLVPEEDGDEDDGSDISDEVRALWGPGYSNSMYRALEQRRQYWISRFPENFEFDVGTEAIIRQICSLELDINRDRIAGKPIDKSVNALNNLLGSANLKPNQKKDETDSSLENTPFGVWIRRWENQRPIPEPDPELQDVDGILKYILTWFYGHLSKMLNIKNTNSQLYEHEIEKYRVQHPEYEGDDDETLLYDIFADDDESDDDE